MINSRLLFLMNVLQHQFLFIFTIDHYIVVINSFLWRLHNLAEARATHRRKSGQTQVYHLVCLYVYLYVHSWTEFPSKLAVAGFLDVLFLLLGSPFNSFFMDICIFPWLCSCLLTFLSAWVLPCMTSDLPCVACRVKLCHHSCPMLSCALHLLLRNCRFY